MSTRTSSTRTSSTRTGPSGPEAGVSIVEVLFALLVFTIGALAAAQHTLAARQQARAGEIITEASAAAQYQMETLRSLPRDSLDSDSDTVWGFPISWTVSGTAPRVVVLSIERPSVLGGMTVDTVVTYAADIGN